MSLSLLQRSIEIIEEDIPSKSTAKKIKKVDPKIRKKRSKRGSEDILEFNDKIKKANFERIKKGILDSKKDRTDENIKKLLRLSTNDYFKTDSSEKLIKRAQTGRYVVDVEKKKEVESVFTEEDFESFEKDYFADL